MTKPFDATLHESGVSPPFTEADSERAIPLASLPPGPPPDMSELPKPGSVLAGKYRVERVLGTGGMAIVAAAYHIQLRQRVAIKYLVPEALEYPEIVERFTREGRVAARIRGEHVARVIDMGVFDSGASFIVLEYLEGRDLAAHLARRGQLRVDRVVRYMLETCEALAEAHASNIVHRDLKPANLFLAKGPDQRKSIKVLDFGVSKIVDEPMTHAQRMLGTVAYMSPEQLRSSSDVDFRTDIWSLGVILYELLAGEPPFTGDNVIAVSKKILANRPVPLRTHRPDVPREIEEVIGRCMRVDPKERYASVLELALALAPIATLRDRESIHRIQGVLHGPGDSSTKLNVASLQLFADPPPGVASGAPPAKASEAPMITPVKSPTPAEVLPVGVRPWLEKHAAWVVAACAAVVLVLSVRSIAERQPAAQPVSREPAPVVLPPPAPATITLRISSATPSASARVDDGPPLPLPIENSIPRDEAEHTIVVQADGHEPWTKTVRFTDDLVLAIALPRKPEPVAPPREP